MKTTDERGPGWEGCHYFGEVEPVEREWGFDLHIRDDTMAYLRDGTLTVFGWYMDGKHEGYLKQFEVGNVVGILQEDTNFRRGWERIFKPEELVTEDMHGKKFEYGGVLQSLDVEAKVSDVLLGDEDQDEQKERLAPRAMTRLESLIAGHMGKLYEMGATCIWRVMRTPPTTMFGLVPGSTPRLEMNAITTYALVGVKK